MIHERKVPSSCTLDNNLYVIGGHASIERLANANVPVNILSPWSIIQLPEEFNEINDPVFCPLNQKDLVILGGQFGGRRLGDVWIIDTLTDTYR